MWAATDLAAAAGPLEPDPPAQLRPVRRIEAAELATDRHGMRLGFSRAVAGSTDHRTRADKHDHEAAERGPIQTG